VPGRPAALDYLGGKVPDEGPGRAFAVRPLGVAHRIEGFVDNSHFKYKLIDNTPHTPEKATLTRSDENRAKLPFLVQNGQLCHTRAQQPRSTV
jgi:hypothetical protein